MKPKLNRKIGPAMILILVLFLLPPVSSGQVPQVDWIEGPGTVGLGHDLAILSLDFEYLFANASDTRKLMQSIGNPVSSRETGLIAPKNGDPWYIVFEYDPVGYIKDDEKADLDADAIFESIREATEYSNQQRIKQGFSTVKLIGWQIEPHYDENAHNLVWALLGEENGEKIVNYNTRLLGRQGYMSVVLVTSLNEFQSLIGNVNGILDGFSYKQGKSYAEYVKGDKLAKIGLTALVAGGAAAAASKFGIFKMLAKGGKAVFIAILAVLSAIWAILKSIFKRRPESAETAPGMPPAQLQLPAAPKKSMAVRAAELVEDGREEDALAFIRAGTRGKIEDLELAGIYYDLLKNSQQVSDLLIHARTYLDLLAEEGEKLTACEIYSECLSLDAKFRPNADGLSKLAQWLAGRGQSKVAMQACVQFSRAYPEHPDIPTVYFLMAKLFNEKLNDTVKAKKVVQWLVKNFPDSKQTLMAKKYLAVIR
ncbi:MAG: hypothetical protein [Olavius algarvensis Delta 4 endosymbiont]|nr:MAG: hypothetical protein [Olavius algarvensis Delta 4 endosymbiont]